MRSDDFGILHISQRGDLAVLPSEIPPFCWCQKHLLFGLRSQVMTYEVFSRQKKVLHCLQAWEMVSKYDPELNVAQ